MNNTPTRTRFAPSPTGFLHIGSLRTALFAYLIAKSREGRFILRIEDTDRKRLVPDADKKLLEILDWAGLEFDEGPHAGGDYGPYVQSERRAIYKKHTERLLEKGRAYHCFCTQERLEKMRQEQQKKKLPPRYDRACRGLKPAEVEKRLEAGEKYVIRQKMPLEGVVVVHDELRGEISFKADELQDHVLIKSDGMPTYHFAVVVDDHLMEISHVLRGEEWISSFPKNHLLYEDFGWEAPKFIHMPLTLNKSGGKLSKRQGDVAVEDYRDKGYLPEALLNFCALLGWHPRGDKELFTLEELIKEFKIKDMGTSPAVFDVEKLNYLNGYYIRHKDKKELLELCRPYLAENLAKTGKEHKKSDEFLTGVIGLEQERLKILSEIGEATGFFFVDQPEYEPELLVWKKMEAKAVKPNLEKVIELLDKIPEENWTNDSIEDAIVSYLKAKELKIGEYLWPMRVALSGRSASPGPFDIAEVLGKSETRERLEYAVNKVTTNDTN